MRIANTARATAGIVVGLLAALGLWCLDRPRPRPEAPTTPNDVLPSRIDLPLETSSSTVEHEPPLPPGPPFYASLFVAGRTWDLPCRVGNRMVGDQPAGIERCHVDSVDITATETRARIACWFVHEPEARDPDPAINTYVMTSRGLYINDTRGTPIFPPHPIPKPLPKRWGQDEPSGPEPDRATAIVRHRGAWCSVYEVQGEDTSFGTSECISARGIVGRSYHRDFSTDSCGDVP